MSTVNFSVPDDVKEAFNAAFSGQNKSAVIAELMREAVERAQRRERSVAAYTRIVERRGEAPLATAAQVRTARRAARAGK